MYKLSPQFMGNQTSVIRTVDSACVPFVSDNTDYQTFKKELAEGASLKDGEGNDMTQEQIATFLGTLP
jgi:hypothetical protein